MQTLITLLIVLGAAGYSVWKLAPAALRNKLAAQSGSLARATGASDHLARRIDGAGSSTDAALAQAEAQAADGDLEGAMQRVDSLPPTARDALATWRAKAQRRVEIDRHVANLRAQALGGLTAFAKTAP